MLEKKIEEISEYFEGISKFEDGYLGIKTKFPSTWVVKEKTFKTYSIIPVCQTLNDKLEVTFVGDKNCKLVDIIDYIKHTITNNIENDSKSILFDEKLKDLVELFDEHNLAELKTLTFKFDKKQKKSSKKVEIENTNNDESNKEESNKEENNT